MVLTEVINLLSSSPPPKPVVSKAPKCKSTATAAPDILVDFNFDDFDMTGDLSYHIDQPAKRRKLSPPRPSRDTTVHTNHLRPITLSSDPVLPNFPLSMSPIVGKRPPPTNPCTKADSIVFSSSAPELTKRRGAKTSDETFDLSSDGLPDDLLQVLKDDIVVSSQPAAEKTDRRGFSSRTETVLATLAVVPHARTNKTLCRSETAVNAPSVNLAHGNSKCQRGAAVDDIIVSSPSKEYRRKAQRSSKIDGAEGTQVEKQAERTALKAAKRAERDAQKEEEKERRRRVKEEKAREKQLAADKAEVNKSKVNKNDSTSEMTVEMSAWLQDTSTGNQVEEYMKNLNVVTRFVDEEVNLVTDNGQCHDNRSTVKWKRKITARYNDENDEWVPIHEHHFEDERHVLLYFSATDFIQVITCDAAGGDRLADLNEDIMRQSVDLYIWKARSTFSSCVLILLIEGLDAWVKKNINAKNREYTAAVRAQAAVGEADSNPQVPSSSSQAKPRKRAKPAELAANLSFVTTEVIDALMLHLQLNHQPIVIQRTSSAATSASEIVKFTQHLSTRPGRLAFQDFNLKSASFCMETGQVKTGDNAQETYIKMLQEVQRITPSMAHGIAAEYNSVQKLVQGFRQSNNLMLEHVHKSTNKDGGWSDKRLGPMVSKRLYKIFMGRDPAATDGMS